MSQYLKLPSARRVVITVLALCALVAMGAAMACSFLISDSLPAGYTCRPNALDAGLCPGDQVCIPLAGNTEGTCTPRCTSTSCSEGLVCDPQGWCVPADGGGPADGTTVPPPVPDAGAEAAAPVGDAGHCSGYACRCSTSADCPQNLVCIDRTAVTPDIWGAWADAGLGNAADTTGGMCLAPCCTSATDCDDYLPNVCFATGAGGNYCVPPGWLGDRGEVGTLPGGQACTGTGAGACRSGLCTPAGYCADTCCSDFTMTECATGTSCRFGPFPGATDGFDKHETARCVPPSAGQGNGATGDPCSNNAACRSNLCIDAGFGGGTQQPGQCHDACRFPDDCTGNGGQRNNTQSCVYTPVVGGLPGDLVAACASVTTGQTRGDAGGGAVPGAPCRATSDCARGYCVSGLCLAVCFANGSTDCLSPERCRPQPVTIGAAMYSVLGCGP